MPRPIRAESEKRADAVALASLVLVVAAVRAIDAVWVPFELGDTLQAFFFFKFAYQTLLFGGELPQWLPQAAYGTPAGLYANTFLGPAQVATLAAGAALGIEDAHALFRFARFLDHVVFVVGLYWLGRRLFEHRATAWVVAAAAPLLFYDNAQMFWNTRIVLFIPLILWALLRFHDDGAWRYIGQAGLFAVLALPGNLAYMAPLYAFVGAVFLIALCVERRRLPPWRPGSLREPATGGWLGLAAAAAGLYGALLVDTVADPAVMVLAPDRDPETMTVSLETFLTYGGDALDKLPEVLLGYPLVHLELFFHVGFVALVLVIFGAARGRRMDGWGAVAATGAVLFLLALGPWGGVAYLAYHFPFMDHFRHLGMLPGLVKVFLLLLAGFGLETVGRAASAPGEAGEAAFRTLFATAAAVAAAVLLAKLLWLKTVLPAFPAGFQTEPFILAVLLIAMAGRRGWRPAGGVGAWFGGLLVAEAIGVGLTYAGGALAPQALSAPALPYRAAIERVARPGFEATRTMDVARHPRGPMLQSLSRMQSVRTPTAYLFAGIDPCFPSLRVDFVLRPVAALAERTLGAGVAWDASPPRPLPAAFAAAVGCDGAKLRLDEDPAAPGRDLGPAVTGFTANRLTVAVDGRGGRLRYADADHPGWRATVDGRPVAIERVDAAFKAVRVPPGPHTVEFRFFALWRDAARFGLTAIWAAALVGMVAAAVRGEGGGTQRARSPSRTAPRSSA